MKKVLSSVEPVLEEQPCKDLNLVGDARAPDFHGVDVEVDRGQ